MATKYRAIIADDEYKLIQLIKHLGNWEELGIEIVNECQDGETALESILKNRPDFVISDIQMPGYDGIELIQKCREQGCDTLFVLLSGYRYFEYARSAIQLNVVDYLLKPIDQEQLCEMLKKLCDTVDHMRRQNQDSEKLQAYEEQKTEQDRSAFWNALEGYAMRREAFLSVEQIEKQYGIRFPNETYAMCCISANLNDDLLSGASSFPEKLSHLIAKAFDLHTTVIKKQTRYGYLLVLNYPEEKEREVKNQISSLFYQLRDLNEIYGDFRVCIGCSTKRSRAEDLSDLYYEAIIAALGRMVYTGSRVLDYKQISSLTSFHADEIFSARDREQLQDALHYLNEEALEEVFLKMQKRGLAYADGSPAAILEILSSLFSVLEEAVADLEEAERTALTNDFYFSIGSATGYEQLFRKLKEVFLKFVHGQRKKMDEKLSKPIEEAIRYLNGSYGQQISLEDAAEKAGVSSVYLSRIFKEKTGLGFNEYLTGIRLEKAQELLAKTTLSVKEISAKVGYPDEKYFSKLFKKTFGIKPTDYRKLYG